LPGDLFWARTRPLNLLHLSQFAAGGTELDNIFCAALALKKNRPCSLWVSAGFAPTQFSRLSNMPAVAGQPSFLCGYNLFSVDASNFGYASAQERP
jgi:hypothetical protein